MKKEPYKFGFGLSHTVLGGTGSLEDEDEILVPMKVQEFIHRSIRTLSNSVSNRSPDDAAAQQMNMRSVSNSLNPIEEIKDELEARWYTLEEKAREEMQSANQAAVGGSPLYEECKQSIGTEPVTNPFRIHMKKERDAQQALVANNLDVKRVKYSQKQMSPADDKNASEEAKATTAPFQPAGKDSRAKGGRRAGGQPAERARQPPSNR